MEKSAGLLLKYQNKILLAHPTRSSWVETYSIPKGKIENNETILQTAIRETREEVGLIIPEQWITDLSERFINYNKKNSIYKRVYYFIVELTQSQKLELMGDSLIIPKNNLQLNEVDHAAFYTKEESKKLIFWRFREFLDLMD